MRLTYTPIVRRANGEIIYKGTPENEYSIAQSVSSTRAKNTFYKNVRASVLQEGTPDKPSRHRADAED